MQKLEDGFARAVEEKIDAIRRQMREPPMSDFDSKTGRRALDQDFIDLLKWRIQVMRQVQDLEKFVKAGLPKSCSA